MKKYILPFILFFTQKLFAQQPCALDNSFNSNGKLISDGGRICDRIQALPNDQSLVVYNPFGGGHVYIRRLLSDGAIDTSYGSSGKTTIQISGTATTIKGMLLLNSKLFVCGTTSSNSNPFAFVACLKSNGWIDSSFGTNGIVTFPSYFTFNDILAEPGSSNLLIAGNKSSGTATILRLTNNGSLDASFGTNGVTNINTNVSGVYYEIRDLSLDKNNRILITGKYYTTQGSNIFTQCAVMRFLSDGNLDTSFDTDGIVFLNSGVNHYDEGCRIFANTLNEYYVAAATYDGFDWDYSLLKLTGNGAADVSFGYNGWIQYDLTGNQEDEYPLNADIMSNDDILFSGNQGSGDTVHFSLFRVKPDGSRDQNFANNGLFIHIFGTNNNNSSAALSITPEGKIYLGGYSRTCQNGTCGFLSGSVARYVGATPFTPAGIPFSSFTSTLTLYPNPAHVDQIIQFTSPTSIQQIHVFDMQGKMIAIEKISDLSFRLVDAAPGLYTVVIATKNGHTWRQLLNAVH